MAKFNILKWLYKHSPINFYNITKGNKTIIKSINNTYRGYEYDRVFSQEEIDKLRKSVKNFKRFYTIAVLISYIAIIYGFIFPNFNLLEEKNCLIIIVTVTAVFIAVAMAFINAKLFEKYLKDKYGAFEKTIFQYSNSFENQSYKDFKIELIKIFALLLILFGVYLFIGSPYETSVNLVEQGRYKDAIKMSTIWSKLLPMESKWYALRAYSKFNIDDFEGAINDYDKAYRIENDEYKFINLDNKIYVMYYLGKYDDALNEYNNEIKEADNDFTRDILMWDKAQFLYSIKRYNQALNIYNRLIINSESDKIYLLQNRLYYERAQVYKKLQQETKAQEDTQKAQNLNLETDFQSPIPEPSLLFERI